MVPYYNCFPSPIQFSGFSITKIIIIDFCFKVSVEIHMHQTINLELATWKVEVVSPLCKV